MRSALGAARSRIVRQLLTESLVLSAAGAILGLGLAFAAVFYLAHQGSIALPLLSSIRIDQTALAWTLFIAVSAGVLFGIVPGLRISSGNLQDALKDSAASTTGGQGTARLRATLVVSQIALACVLLIAAGIFQWTPLKRTCLNLCRSPLSFVMGRWRERRAGAFVMGLRHGLYCLGCCWALMALLFVAGVMNLLWVAAIAVAILVEKVVPRGDLVGRLTGVILVAAGVLLMARGVIG